MPADNKLFGLMVLRYRSFGTRKDDSLFTITSSHVDLPGPGPMLAGQNNIMQMDGRMDVWLDPPPHQNGPLLDAQATKLPWTSRCGR